MPITVLGSDKSSKAGCAAERVPKGEEPTVHLFILSGSVGKEIRLLPQDAEALGQALLKDAQESQTFVSVLGGSE